MFNGVKSTDFVFFHFIIAGVDKDFKGLMLHLKK